MTNMVQISNQYVGHVIRILHLYIECVDNIQKLNSMCDNLFRRLKIGGGDKDEKGSWIRSVRYGE